MLSVAGTDPWADVAHLYRRAGFGGRPDELEAAAAAGYEATVERLLGSTGADTGLGGLADPVLTAPRLGELADPAARQALQQQLARERQELSTWWLARMASATNPFPEKRTLFWHGHFATSIEKVRIPLLMYRQNRIFRSQGDGDFHALTLAVAQDPAMLIWLDAASDRKDSPNENFARELMELFTLGTGNYTEDDVRAGARAFTGWRLDRRDYSFAFDAADHDDGMKTFLGHTGDLSGEDVIDIVTHHPASPRWVASRVWSHFAYPTDPSDPVLDELVAAYTPELSLSALFRALFLHPEFRGDRARSGLVKQPIEYVVGAVRVLAPDLLGPQSATPADGPGRLLSGVLAQLGQVPFDPPNVGGWPQNGYWLTTASSLARLRFATSLVRRADLSAVEDAPSSGRVEATARLLGISQWSDPTSSALSQVAGDPRSLVALALASPEYVLNYSRQPTKGSPVTPAPMSRRRFLTVLAGTGAAGALGVGMARHGFGSPTPAVRRTGTTPGGPLVLVALYGGNDGLNTVVPYEDSHYLAARGTLGYGAHEVLPVGDGLGLHPNLKGLKGLWDAGHLAIVRGVGYPDPVLSHFRSMAIWQSASPAAEVSTGWVGRWLDATGTDPLRAVSVGPTLPLLASGERTAAAAVPATSMDLPAGPGLKAAFAAMSRAPAASGLGVLGARVLQSGSDLLEVQAVVSDALAAQPATDLGNTNSLDAGGTAAAGGPPSGSSKSPASAPAADNPLATQLDLVARLIKAGVSTRIYMVSLGGFDTHSAEKDTHAHLLSQLDQAVAGFLSDVSTHRHGKGTVVATFSEFGRRAAANASAGTDHGTAAPMFVAGQPVKGGFYGEQPSLAALDAGTLEFTTDFRSVYATLLGPLLGYDPDAALSGRWPTLALI